MKKKKSNLQKFSLLLAIVSVISAIACIIYLFFNIETLGWQNPVSASLLASTFFFFFISFIFIVIGVSDIPSFKVTSDND